MSVLWHKIWFDLWRNKLRTLLVVVSIAVGVFAVGTTFGMVEQLLPTMDASHQNTLPSHVTMYLTQPLDRDEIIGLSREPGVEQVESLNVVEVRYKTRPGEKWRKGNILMRDDYQHQVYDLFQLKAGQWPEDENLSIERMHSPFYGIDIGDQVIFEVDGKERAFPITGKIRHPFVPPPTMYDLAWFFSGEEVMEQFGIPKGKFTQLKFRVNQYSDENARLIASQVKERLAKQGISVGATMYQDPDTHWGRMFVDGMALVTQVLAVISMLLSVVLVLNTLTAVITQQTNQIGILKAIGGSSFTVTRHYLALVLIYGLLALGVALPLGAIASFSITRWFLGLYNIEYDIFNYSTRVIIIQVLVALAIPLLVALWPILHGASITVRQAIASYGLGGDFSRSWLDGVVERISRRILSSFYTVAITNTFRRKGRLVLTQMVLVIAGVMFLMVMSLSSSMKATLDAEFGRRSYDMIIYFQDLQRVDRTVALADSIKGVTKANMWLVEPATILHEGQRTLDAGLGSQLQGVPVDEPMYTPLIVEGRWLRPGDGRAIVMNKDTADDESIRVGDTITLDLGEHGLDDWQVVGLYRVFVFFGGGFSIDAIYAPRQAVYEASKKVGKASFLLVRTDRHTVEGVSQIAGDLEDLLQERNMEISQIETLPQTRRTSDTAFSYVIWMLLVLAIIVALVGGIGLMGSLSISVIERTKEIGMLRAIGARSGHIMRMFILEAIVQALLSWGIAVPLSMLLTPLMANALGMALFNDRLDYQYNLGAVGFWLASILVIAVLASMIPASNAARVNVRQSLTYE